MRMTTCPYRNSQYQQIDMEATSFLRRLVFHVVVLRRKGTCTEDERETIKCISSKKHIVSSRSYTACPATLSYPESVHPHDRYTRIPECLDVAGVLALHGHRTEARARTCIARADTCSLLRRLSSVCFGRTCIRLAIQIINVVHCDAVYSKRSSMPAHAGRKGQWRQAGEEEGQWCWSIPVSAGSLSRGAGPDVRRR